MSTTPSTRKDAISTAGSDATGEAVEGASALVKPISSDKNPKPWVRLIAFLAAAFTAWHIFASFLWIAPYSENAREVVPAGMLTSYMIPFFGQSWSVFAPEPINGDYHFNVRAVLIDDDGQRSETGWVSATDVELSMIQYNLTPPRGGIQSSEVASSYKDAFDKMEDLDRAVIGGDFEVDNWEVGLRAALETPQADAAASSLAPETRTARIDDLLSEEHRSTAYATQVAKAIWGDDVQQVQYRVSRQNIIPFAQRHNPDAQRPEPMVVLPGWRGLVVEPGQNEGNFANIFRSQFERITP